MKLLLNISLLTLFLCCNVAIHAAPVSHDPFLLACKMVDAWNSGDIQCIGRLVQQVPPGTFQFATLYAAQERVAQVKRRKEIAEFIEFSQTIERILHARMRARDTLVRSILQ